MARLVDVFVIKAPDEAEHACELLRDKGISTRLEAVPGSELVEGPGVADIICLEVHTEDRMAADTALEDGI